ncbi:MAG: BrxE family protein [Verrucomicrobiales bacterium]|nr:BrxE family protein [Verrucomicrobiales bacterium]
MPKPPGNDPLSVIRLRTLVAFLGERGRHGWWDCSFLDNNGRRFLERPFPRTAFHAALRSACAAASAVHDAAIGRRGVFHLFRLPPEREAAMDLKLSQVPAEALLHLVGSADVSIAELRKLAAPDLSGSPGPIHIGTESQIGAPKSQAVLAAHYLLAFASGVRAYPYFASAAHG